MALPLGRFLRQDVIQKSLTMLEFTGAGTLKALSRPTIGFHFWHDGLLFFPRRDNHHHLSPFHAWPLFNHTHFR